MNVFGRKKLFGNLREYFGQMEPFQNFVFSSNSVDGVVASRRQVETVSYRPETWKEYSSTIALLICCENERTIVRNLRV